MQRRGSGSGSSGTAFSQGLTYDAASNLVSLATTQAAVPGQSGSGGSETQNFCYDEQNRLVWAGNSGTQPGAGNGTCGSGTLSNTLSGASYSNSYVYTHLGQLWQGPLNGGSTQYQYLYCNSSTLHQLTGLYPTGTTCSNKTGQVYTSSYDAFGNVTSRFYSGTTATLSYDALDHFTQWNAGSNNFEQYVYDASGERVLRRSTNGSGTSMTVYAFGLEDHSYSSSGSNTGNTYYYRLAGRLLGKWDGTNTTFYLVDVLGTPQASFSNVVNSATLKGNQVYGPYGKQRYHQGAMGTPKGFTGQYNDSLTGLDYYGARYYDPVAGVFLSADRVAGNILGMNPYAYVSGNPETHNDPTGLRAMPPVCPSYPGCNAPVDKSTLFAGIIAGVGSASGNYKTQGVTDYVPPVTKPSLPTLTSSSTPTSVLTSCGAPITQSTCGNFGAHYAFYTPVGVLSLPGEVCFVCGGPGRGSENSGDSGGNNDLFAASDIEGGNPPDGWERMDYGPDNKVEILDFTHTDEAGNTLEATLYRQSGELQISWMDSLKQAKSHLPGLVNWLGESVQTVKGHVSDNFATYFSPRSRGVTLVNRMFSSVLEEAGFAQGTIEIEGSKIWIVFKRATE